MILWLLRGLYNMLRGAVVEHAHTRTPSSPGASVRIGVVGGAARPCQTLSLLILPTSGWWDRLPTVKSTTTIMLPTIPRHYTAHVYHCTALLYETPFPVSHTRARTRFPFRSDCAIIRYLSAAVLYARGHFIINIIILYIYELLPSMRAVGIYGIVFPRMCCIDRGRFTICAHVFDVTRALRYTQTMTRSIISTLDWNGIFSRS